MASSQYSSSLNQFTVAAAKRAKFIASTNLQTDEVTPWLYQLAYTYILRVI